MRIADDGEYRRVYASLQHLKGEEYEEAFSALREYGQRVEWLKLRGQRPRRGTRILRKKPKP